MPPDLPYSDERWAIDHADPPIIPPGATLTLIGLVVVYAMNGRATVREVAMASGRSSPATVHGHLRQLRRAGLCTWEDGATGTLRPLVDVVEGPWTTQVFDRHPSARGTGAVPSRSQQGDHDHDRATHVRRRPGDASPRGQR